VPWEIRSASSQTNKNKGKKNPVCGMQNVRETNILHISRSGQPIRILPVFFPDERSNSNIGVVAQPVATNSKLCAKDGGICGF